MPCNDCPTSWYIPTVFNCSSCGVSTPRNQTHTCGGIEVKRLRVGFEALIRSCRRDGVCVLCNAPLSTMHVSDCPVLVAVFVLEPSYGAVADRPIYPDDAVDA